MIPRKSLKILLAVCASALSANAATYTQDFNFPDGTFDLGDGSMLNGTAQIVGERLQLSVDGGASGFGSFGIPAIADSSLGWTATFDVEIFDSPAGNVPADGFSLNYGNAPISELGSAEEGMAGIGFGHGEYFLRG